MNAPRQSPRQVMHRVVSIQIEPNIQAIVQNISEGGLGFHALTPVTQSGTLRFSFSENNQQTEASGELVWIDSTKKTGGLRFAALPPASRERIRNWVHQADEATSAEAASEPIGPRPNEFPIPGLHLRQTNAASRRYVPPPDAPMMQPAIPRFALPEDDPQRTPYSWDQEAFLRGSRPRFFQGFVTGAIASAILAAVLFFAYGDPGTWLTQGRAKTSASPPPQAVPQAPQRPAAAYSQLPSSGLPPSGSIETPAPSAPVPDSGDSNANGAAAQTRPEPPTAGVAPAQQSLPPKGTDSGDADFALAERYLREKSGPGSSAAAANALWAAVRKGNVSAEIVLADLYARGDGVRKNCDQARVLLRAAAEKGSTLASRELGEIIRTGCR
jgi:hypothetical protein